MRGTPDTRTRSDWERFADAARGSIRKTDRRLPPEDVDEITQDCLARLKEHWDTVHEKTALSWIRRVAKNLTIDRYRHGKPKLDLEVREERPPGAPRSGGTIPPQRSFSSVVADRVDLAPVLVAALETVSADNRYLFVAHCYQGVPVEDLAEEFGLSPRTIRNRISQTRGQLRDFLGEAEERGVVDLGSLPRRGRAQRR